MSYKTVAEISLKNLQNNANNVKKLLNSKTKFYAVVKSNAYGHGIVEVSNALYNIVDAFCVSLIDEAVKLRVAGIDKDILMLTPAFLETVNELVRYNITISVSSLKELKLIDKTAKNLNAKAKIQLKINTGMNRYGIEADETEEICRFLKKYPRESFFLATKYFLSVLQSTLRE